MSDPMNQIFEKLGSMDAKIDAIQTDMNEVKDGVSDYRQTKNKLIGACVAVSATVGGGLSAVLNKLGIEL